MRSPTRPLVLALLSLLALPGAAAAATVSVVEETGFSNHARLSFAAAPGESNATIVAISGEEGEHFKLTVVDTGAPLAAGAGCSGGGAAATPVTCRMHKPHAEEFNVIGGKVAVPVSGTRWEVEIDVGLGDSDNSFDAHSFSGIDSDRVDMTVRGGPGRDTIYTGGGADLIDPGAGEDSVHTGAAYDEVVTTPTTDGPDLYDLGLEVGKVDYSSRQDPVVYGGRRAGAVGENDLILAGLTFLVGGAGDDSFAGGGGLDIFEGRDGADSLRGGGGDDTLIGGRGEDEIRGERDDDLLVGEPGRDRLVGGVGDDRLADALARIGEGRSPAVIPAVTGPSGGDVGIGGPGDDLIVLGPGNDRESGGPGDDRLHGQEGDDRIAGAAGADLLIGGSGHDRMMAGTGSDALLGGRTPITIDAYLSAPDDGPDLLGCGPGRDTASANPWDTTRVCEVVETVSPKPSLSGRRR